MYLTQISLIHSEGSGTYLVLAWYIHDTGNMWSERTSLLKFCHGGGNAISNCPKIFFYPLHRCIKCCLLIHQCASIITTLFIFWGHIIKITTTVTLILQPNYDHICLLRSWSFCNLFWFCLFFYHIDTFIKLVTIIFYNI